jgi:hypothetical protein
LYLLIVGCLRASRGLRPQLPPPLLSRRTSCRAGGLGPPPPGPPAAPPPGPPAAPPPGPPAAPPPGPPASNPPGPPATRVSIKSLVPFILGKIREGVFCMHFIRRGLHVWLISVTLTGRILQYFTKDLSVFSLIAKGQLIIPPRVPRLPGQESNREPAFWQAGALTTQPRLIPLPTCASLTLALRITPRKLYLFSIISKKLSLFKLL